MSTIYDLAERYDMDPAGVQRWLRGRGLIGRKDTNVTHGAEQAFQRAHGGQIDSPTRAFLHAEPAPEQALPHRFQPAVAAPAPPPPDPAVEGFYRRQHDALLAQFRALQSELAQTRAKADAAARKAAQRSAPAPEAPPPPPTPEPKRRKIAAPAKPAAATLAAALEDAGFVGDGRRSALRALVATPEGADALLEHARVSPEAVAILQPVCNDKACRRVSAMDGRVAVQVSASRCDVCHASPNRRWYALMARQAVRSGKPRVIVVGGADDSHAALAGLASEHPKLKLTIVEGDRKTTGQRARTKVRGADVVVIWAGTQLDHAVSGVYKAAADGEPSVTRVMVPDGARGIAAMARAVVEVLQR